MKQEKREKLSVIATDLISVCSLPESEKKILAESIAIELRVAYLEGQNDATRDIVFKLTEGE